jgi:outer membrane immunogenic protein
MSRLRIASALLGLFFGWNQAIAADLTDNQAPYEPPMAPIWAGLYVGGHVGGLWSSEDSIGLASRCKEKRNCWCHWCYSEDWKEVKHHKFTSDDDDDVSLLGGLHIGYNLQDGDLVYGIEADASFSDRVDYLASLRGRLGVAFNELLIYATAGIAFAGFDDNQVYWDGKYKKFPVGKSDDDMRVGLVVGAGAEYKIAPNLSVGLEGLYYAFADRDDSYGWDWFCKEYKLTAENDNDMYVVRGRLTYHLQDAYEAPLK